LSSFSVGRGAVPQRAAMPAALAGAVVSASNTPSLVATMIVRARRKLRWVSISVIGARPSASARRSSGFSAATVSFIRR
jgi:hypothetical protein